MPNSPKCMCLEMHKQRIGNKTPRKAFPRFMKSKNHRYNELIRFQPKEKKYTSRGNIITKLTRIHLQKKISKMERRTNSFHRWRMKKIDMIEIMSAKKATNQRNKEANKLTNKSVGRRV